MENHLPDVLETLANLSSDEVFTPPQIANNVLDMLPQEIFKNKDAKFLDPCSKSGVFLREIAKRLDKGLENQIPDRQERINHIMHNQIYGIGITYLTAFLSRRSLYGACYADTPYSLADFDIPEGNVLFHNMEHTWDIKGKCQICGANKDSFQGEYTDNHAYEFIHRDPKEIFNMKFDVIIGNPPYQLDDGGNGASAKPIYHYFVENAKKMNPKYLCMIMPSRWFVGGKGLDEFREEMVNDIRIKELHDFMNAGDIFPGVEIKGGVCYFLWDRDYHGDCKITTYYSNNITSTGFRKLKYKNYDIYIRHNNAISILEKIQKLGEKSFSEIVSSRKPFGFATNFTDFIQNKPLTDIYIYIYANQKQGWVRKDLVEKNKEYINKYKIYITKAYGAGETYPHQILNNPFFGDKNTCCTETYLVIGPFDTKIESENIIKYIKTKFLRFLVLLSKISQDATQKVYQFVPMQDFTDKSDIDWSQEIEDIENQLYTKYGIDQKEIDFINSMIRPMGADNDK